MGNHHLKIFIYANINRLLYKVIGITQRNDAIIDYVESKSWENYERYHLIFYVRSINSNKEQSKSSTNKIYNQSLVSSARMLFVGICNVTFQSVMVQTYKPIIHFCITSVLFSISTNYSYIWQVANIIWINVALRKFFSSIDNNVRKGKCKYA